MNDPLPGFGWTSRLTRWMGLDRTEVGMEGPLPPPTARQTGKSADPFDNLSQGMLGGTGGTLNQFSAEPQSRGDLYRIYDVMDRTDIASSVLDLYAEDATQVDPDTNRTVWVKSKNKAMVDEANAMMTRINLEEELTGLARDLCKYGDDFERLVYRSADGENDADAGLARLVPVRPTEMTRKQTKDGKLEGYSQTGKKYKGGNSATSNAWDYAHFRLRGQDRQYPYGTSILKNAIRPWRQMVILEDWMLRYQVSRHPDRNAFLIDIGAAGEGDGIEMARRFSTKLKRHVIVDPMANSGRNFGVQMDPILPDEDMVLALRKDSATRIEKLSGSGNAADIVPLNYTLTKFFAAVRAPRAFFGFDVAQGGEINMKASLTGQDIRYARTCERVQRALKAGIQWLHEFNYTLKMGNNPENTKFDFNLESNAFTVHMSPISFLRELERLEVMQIRQTVGVALADMGRDNPAYRASAWTKFILREIIRIPEKEIERVLRTADEVIAAQSAILQAKPVDVHTAMPTGVGGQLKLAQQQASQQADLNQDQQDLAAKDQAHRHKMDKAQLAQAQQEAADLAKRAADAAADARARGLVDGGDLNSNEVQLLSEVLATSPKLRALIEKGVMLWREDGDSIPEKHGLVLPDRKCAKLFEKGPLKDELTEADLKEMAEESIDETDRAGT